MLKENPPFNATFASESRPRSSDPDVNGGASSSCSCVLTEEEIDQLMGLHIMREVLAMGFSQKAVKIALKRRLNETGLPFFSLETAIESILLVMDEETKRTISGCEYITSQAKMMSSCHHHTPVIATTSIPPENDISTATTSITVSHNINSTNSIVDPPNSISISTASIPVSINSQVTSSVISPLTAINTTSSSPPLRSSTPASQIENNNDSMEEQSSSMSTSVPINPPPPPPLTTMPSLVPLPTLPTLERHMSSDSGRSSGSESEDRNAPHQSSLLELASTATTSSNTVSRESYTEQSSNPLPIPANHSESLTRNTENNAMNISPSSSVTSSVEPTHSTSSSSRNFTTSIVQSLSSGSDSGSQSSGGDENCLMEADEAMEEASKHLSVSQKSSSSSLQLPTSSLNSSNSSTSTTSSGSSQKTTGSLDSGYVQAMELDYEQKRPMSPEAGLFCAIF